MAKRNKKSLVLIILAFIFLAGAIFTFWLYWGTLTPQKAQIFRSASWPMALVNGHPVLVKDYLDRLALANKLNSTQNLVPASQTRLNVYRELVGESETRQIAQSHGVFVSPQDLRDGWAALASSTPALAGYGVSEDYFSSQVLEPELLLVNLRVWFNSQQNLNQLTYSQADDLIGQIKSGGDMAALAVRYSADPSSGPVGGDLGFIQPTVLLPELREQVAGLAVGDIKLLPSRLGLHIIRVEAKSGNFIQIRQILLPCPGFQAWLQSQTAKFKVVQFLNI